MEVLAGNCTASKVGGRAIRGWSGFLSPGASISVPAGRLDRDNRESSAGGWFGGRTRSLEAGECNLLHGWCNFLWGGVSLSVGCKA